MADVTMSISPLEIKKKDVEFVVKVGNKSFGKLKVSSGTVEWAPKGTSKGFHMKWKEFDKMMKENGTKTPYPHVEKAKKKARRNKNK